MIYLNQCPECKSKNITFQKKIRFFKTMLLMFSLSVVAIFVWVHDANKIVDLETFGEMKSSYPLPFSSNVVGDALGLTS
jgi:hypothetical protein